MARDIASPPAEIWEPRIPREQLWPVMAGILLVMLLASLDQTIVSTALPRVIADLNGFDRYSWVATVYLLTSTVTVPIYGKLSDIYGRKPILLGGVILFLIGSATSGAAQSMNELIAARALQGLGAGALVPIVIAVMGDLFSPKERGKWQGLTGAVWGFAAIVGPGTGGWITDHLSWRWVFYINLPVGLAALLVLIVLMPPLRFGKPGTTIDYRGAALLIAALVPLLLALTWAGSTYSWTSFEVLGLFGWSALALVAFVLVELRQPQPIMEPRLFKNGIYAVSVAVTFFIGAIMFGNIFFVPLFIQGVIGKSATQSGTAITPLMLTAILGSILSGQLLSRWGRYRIQALAGLILLIAGFALLLPLDAGSQYTAIVLPMIVTGAGLGFGMALYTVVVQNAVPPSMIGQVTSGLTLFRQLGGTIGLAVFGSFMISRFTTNIRTALPPEVTKKVPAADLQAFDNPQTIISPRGQAGLHRLLSDHFGSTETRIFHEVHLAIARALASALHDVFVCGLIIAIITLGIAWFLKEIPLRAAAAPAQRPELSQLRQEEPA